MTFFFLLNWARPISSYFYNATTKKFITSASILAWRTVGHILKNCKETSNLMWLPMIWFILFLFVCWSLFCTIANLRIECVTEIKNVPALLYKNLKSSFLHDSHIWLWGFFTLLDVLAHGVAAHLNKKNNIFKPKDWINSFQSQRLHNECMTRTWLRLWYVYP